MKSLQKKIKEARDKTLKEPAKNLQIGNPNSNIILKNTLEVRKAK